MVRSSREGGLSIRETARGRLAFAHRGITPAPKTIPDGACDAKAISASGIRYAQRLTGVLDMDARTRAFWMKFGTATLDGEPFIWSKSLWPDQKLRSVPDRVAGPWTLLKTRIR